MSAGVTYRAHRQWLDLEQMQACFEALNHEFVAPCSNELLHRLMAGAGIVALRGGEPLQPDEGTRSFLASHMAPCAQGAFHSACAIGLACVALRRAPGVGVGEDELVPYVPTPGSYAIATWHDHGIQRYAFHWLRPGGAARRAQRRREHRLRGDPDTAMRMPGTVGGDDGGAEQDVDPEPDPNVYVLDEFGFAPLLDGTLRSPAHAALGQLLLERELTERLVIAERINTLPPVFCEADPASRNPKPNPRLKGAAWMGEVSSCTATGIEALEEDEQQRAVFNEHLAAHLRSVGQNWEAWMGEEQPQSRLRRRPGAGGAPAGAARNYRGHEMLESHCFELPLHSKLVRPEMPRSHPEYLRIVEHAQDAVAAIWGVSRTVFSGGGAAGRVSAGNAESGDALTRRTERWWADRLGRVLTLAYNVTRGAALFKRELAAYLDYQRAAPTTKNAAAAAAAGDADLAPQGFLVSLAGRLSVRLTFDLPPVATQQELRELYGMGWLSYQTAGRCSLRLAGMDASDLGAATDPFEPDERKAHVVDIKPPPAAAAAGTVAAAKRPNR